MTLPRLTCAVVALMLITGAPAGAQAPQRPASPDALSPDVIAQAVRRYITTQTAKHGRFWMHDAVENRSLALQFVRVHADRVGSLSADLHFASVEFRQPDATTLWVDVFMRGATADLLEPERLAVQEIGGKARYTWHRQNGMWRQQPADQP